MERTLVAAILLALASAAHADPAATFKSKCAICHGPEAKGTKLAPVQIAGLPVDQVKKAIQDGKGKMKPVQISDADAVAEFVSAMKK